MLFAARGTLRKLFLDSMDLTELPAAVTQLDSLKILSVYGNPICDLPAGPYLASLEMLDMGENSSLLELPPVLAACNKLRLLFLDGCRNLDAQTGTSKQPFTC